LTRWSRVLGERQQAATATAQRVNNATRLQCDGTGQGSRSPGRDTSREATQPMGMRRMDRSLERAVLGVGRPIRQGQGPSQRQGQERRGILVRGTDTNC
jgi:hypothetical protein